MADRTPWATWALTGANVYIALFVTGLVPTEAALGGWTFGRSDLAAGDWGALFRSLFAHAGLLHLAGNMLGLVTLGPAVERQFGPWRFVLLYLGAGVAGALAHVAYQSVPVLGASGAIFGLLGLMAVLRPRATTVVFGLIPLPILLAGALYVALVPFLPQGEGLPIAHEAHLGGMFLGALAAFVLAPVHALKAVPGVVLVLGTTWYAVATLVQNGVPDITAQDGLLAVVFVVGAYVAAFQYLAWVEPRAEVTRPGPARP